MSNKGRLIILPIILFSFIFLPSSVGAASQSTSPPSTNSLVERIKEKVEYLFAFKVENKVEVLEKHAEKRLVEAQNNVDQKNNTGVVNSLQGYLDIKGKQDQLLAKSESGDVLGAVEERTIDQQRTMEEIKAGVDDEVKQEVVRVQEQVVNQVAQRVVVVNGPEGQNEFFQKVEHVWAPGTGPGGGEAGVVIEGGTMQFAPGTSAGGESQPDIQQHVVIEGGGQNGNQNGNGGGNSSN